MLDADLTDREIEHICRPRTQNAAKVRHLRDMGLFVRQAPDGRPLVNRAHYDEVTAGKKATSSTEPDWTVSA